VTEARPQRPSFGFARRNGATVTAWSEQGATVAHRVGVKPEVVAELRRHCGVPLTLQVFDASGFDKLLRELYEGGSDDAQAMVAGWDGNLDGNLDLNQLADALPEPTDLLESDDDAPIIRLINALLTQAVKENASDIHIEPFENRLVVRYRVDGVLREVLAPQKAVAQPVVSRIKVMAKLDIAEKRLPQDGRIGLRIAGRPVDVRVSTIPAGHGERVVLRLLDKQAGRLDLSQLGMDAAMRDQIDALIHRPHGIVLVTGPTGSGKTTTLYAALTRLNDATRNILTVEDPIEYYLDGVGQTQVNPKVEMTFARGLRAILRQDPDVVMVGEIRDLETAEIAVQASLTGHLVLSTLHTNSAVGAATRLRDMGIEPFLLSSSLLGVLAQRLVRVLDPATREAYTPTQAECAAFGRAFDPGLRFYRPSTAARGRNAGYKGRTGIYELVLIDDALRRLIHDGAGEHELLRAARARTSAMLDDGWNKVVAGVTSVDEVLRVTRDD
jgi:general secretion pathway protein E